MSLPGQEGQGLSVPSQSSLLPSRPWMHIGSTSKWEKPGSCVMAWKRATQENCQKRIIPVGLCVGEINFHCVNPLRFEVAHCNSWPVIITSLSEARFPGNFQGSAKSQPKLSFGARHTYSRKCLVWSWGRCKHRGNVGQWSFLLH